MTRTIDDLFIVIQSTSSRGASPSSQQWWSAAFSVAGPAIWNFYQTVWEMRPSAETPSSVYWRRFYFQLTRIH